MIDIAINDPRIRGPIVAVVQFVALATIEDKFAPAYGALSVAHNGKTAKGVEHVGRNGTGFIAVQEARQRVLYVGNVARTRCGQDGTAPIVRVVLNHPRADEMGAEFHGHGFGRRALYVRDGKQVFFNFESHN